MQCVPSDVLHAHCRFLDPPTANEQFSRQDGQSIACVHVLKYSTAQDYGVFGMVSTTALHRSAPHQTQG